MSLAESNLWDSVLRAIKTKLQGESFETWFNPIRFEGIDKAQRLIRLRAPNQVLRDWVKVNYANLMDQTFGEFSLGGYSVDWILPEENSKPDWQQAPGPVVVRQTERSSELHSPAPQNAANAVAPAREISLDPALNSNLLERLITRFIFMAAWDLEKLI
jgi:chromosomal replication initiation ATPase DnaA